MSPAIQTDNREVERDEPVKNGAAPDDIVLWVENHLESWRQLMHFIGVARGQKFDGTDEDQFLELKGVIVQELEMILASAECNSPWSIPGQQSLTEPSHVARTKFSSQNGHVAHCLGRTG